MENIYGETRIVLPEKIEIPKLSKEELIALYKKIKPMITYYGEKYLLKEYNYDQLLNIAYTMDFPRNKGTLVDPYNLKEVEEFPCLHTWGHYSFFKPTIAEVLSQLPELSKEEANVFEIVESPNTANDLNMYKELTEKGFQLSKVRTYRLYK